MKVKSVSDVYSSYLDDIERLEKENKKLKEQLKEANRLIKVDADFEGWESAKKYLKKWGVK